RADLASLDAVTWQLLSRHDACAKDLKVVGQTDPTPGLPLIAGLGADQPAIFAAVAAAIDNSPPADRDLLHLHGLVAIPAADYLAVPLPAPPAC
ncbi:MAG: phosphate/phosphite/phosphonate ABC transporter substrate-binding protein, partial [Paracoccaceae bacterium]